jgi:hypothetical protein
MVYQASVLRECQEISGIGRVGNFEDDRPPMGSSGRALGRSLRAESPEAELFFSMECYRSLLIQALIYVFPAVYQPDSSAFCFR